mgnify:CR=1 FL=1
MGRLLLDEADKAVEQLPLERWGTYQPVSLDEVLAQARKVVAESLPDAVGFTAALETWPDLRRSFEEGIKRVLVDGADLDQTLEHLNKEWDRILGEAVPATMEAVPRPERVP